MPVLQECATVSSSMIDEGKKSGGELRGRVALVTGAAKRLGRAVALRLAEEGADVVVHYHSSPADAQSTVAEIEKAGRRGFAVAADLASVGEIKRLFDETAKQFGRLDILVNSAANFLPSFGEARERSLILQTRAGCSAGRGTSRTPFRKREWRC